MIAAWLPAATRSDDITCFLATPCLRGYNILGTEAIHKYKKMSAWRSAARTEALKLILRTAIVVLWRHGDARAMMI